MNTTPPSLIVASTQSAVVDSTDDDDRIAREVDQCAATEIASLPSAESRRSYVKTYNRGIVDIFDLDNRGEK